MNFKKIVLHPKIVILKFKNQYEMNMSMMRAEEFSENSKIRGKILDLEPFMDTMASQQEDGNFHYTNEVLGTNMDWHTLCRFNLHALGVLTERERRVFASLECFRYCPNFCIISVFKYDEILKHELAHALYFMDEEYKDKSDELSSSLSPTCVRKITEWLRSKSYHRSAYMDEFQAFLSSDSRPELRDRFGELPWKIVSRFRRNLSSAMKRNGLDQKVKRLLGRKM